MKRIMHIYSRIYFLSESVLIIIYILSYLRYSGVVTAANGKCEMQCFPLNCNLSKKFFVRLLFGRNTTFGAQNFLFWWGGKFRQK